MTSADSLPARATRDEKCLRATLGLAVYSVFASGPNEYYDDPLLHISPSQNHISFNSLSLRDAAKAVAQLSVGCEGRVHWYSDILFRFREGITPSIAPVAPVRLHFRNKADGVSGMKSFRAIDFGCEPYEVDCKPTYRRVEIQWSQPEPWGKDEKAPLERAQEKPGYLYAISWDHHLATRRESIAYIGITCDLDRRFLNHPKATELRGRKRRTFLSIGHVDFGRLTRTSDRTTRVTEELEHVLIWALWQDTTLENDRKQYGLPGFGSRGGGAWHIFNTGHRFGGRMPREIVYPWMLIKLGRDRSLKASAAS